MASTTARPTVAPALTTDELVRRGALALGLTLLVNGLLRVAGVALQPGLADVDPFGWTAIVVVSAVAGVGAMAVYALLNRFSPAPVRHFRIAAVVVLALSMVPLVFGAADIAGLTTLGIVVLAGMHVVSAAVIVAALTAPSA